LLTTGVALKRSHELIPWLDVLLGINDGTSGARLESSSLLFQFACMSMLLAGVQVVVLSG
jgi:hypothetical protein